MLKQQITKAFQGKEFFGHPSGLYVLFFTEMWERFSFYGMRALLVLYMTKYLLFEPERAADVLGYTGLENFLISVYGPQTIQGISSHIYGLYTGFVYFTPFFGGILADKFIGRYKSVYVGGFLMAVGHFLMAFENLFLLALLFIILGNGAFKPNISTQVSTLYPEGDSRRDAAFGIFYMGINSGALLAPLVCGTLGQVYGWHYGFTAAGVGMIIGLVAYYLGSGLLPKAELVRQEMEKTEKRPLTSQEWKAVWALLVLCFLNITFWAVYEQQGNTLQLWADDKTNWSFFGLFNIPSTWYQSFNPAFIIIFTPFVIKLWAWQKSKGKEPSSVVKMGIGCILCGAAYIFMIAASKFVPGAEKGSVMWLAMTTWMFTMGEIYLSPIGLSLVTKVSPKPIVSMMMGAWFMSSFFGNYLTGFIGSFYERMPHDTFFTMLFALGVVTGVVFYLLRKPVSNAIGKDV